MRPLSKAAAAILGVAVAIAAPGCGGGGGGGGSTPPTDPPPPTRSLMWSSNAPGSGQTVYLDVRDVSNVDRFVLQVRISGGGDLYGVAFDIVFPSDLVSFDEAGVEEGNFLPGSSFDTELQIAESPAGNLVVGYTRVGDVRGRNGNGLLLELPFTTTQSGTAAFQLDPGGAFDSGGGAQPTDWLGGELTIRR